MTKKIKIENEEDRDNTFFLIMMSSAIVSMLTTLFVIGLIDIAK
jgi:hypothetical protein